MKTYLTYLVIPVMIFVMAVPVTAQSQDIGIIPVNSSTSNTIFLVDGDAGELINFVDVREKPFYTAINNETGILYILTRHYAYAVDTETAEIQTEYRFMEIMEKQPDEVLDPNDMIYPLGVTKDGIAFYSYNRQSRDLQLEMQAAVKRQDFEASTKASMEHTKIMLNWPVSRVDIHAQQTEPYRMFHVRDSRPSLISPDGRIYVWSETNSQLHVEDSATGEILRQYNFPALNSIPELAGVVPSPPMPVTGDIYSIMYSTFNQQTMQSVNFMMFYDAAGEEILSIEPTDQMHGMGALTFVDSNQLWYGKAECNVGPMPAAPDFGEPRKYTKKAIAQWEEQMAQKQKEHKEALDEWQKRATDPTRCTLSLFADADMNESIVNVPSARFGTVYNNNTLVVNRGTDISSYDINSGNENWSVDIDF